MRMFAALVAAALLAGCQPSATSPNQSRFGGGSTPTPPQILVEPAAPVVGAPITFSDAGLFAQGDYTRVWTFGDGGSATGGASVTHTFADVGMYEVTLEGSDGKTMRSASVVVSVTNGTTTSMPPQPQARQPY